MPFLRPLLKWLLVPVCTLVLSGGCSLKQAPRSQSVKATLNLKSQRRVGAIQSSSIPLPNNPNSYFLLIVNGDGIEPSPFTEGACIGLTASTSYFFSAYFTGERTVEISVPMGRNRKVTLAFLEFIPGSKDETLPMDGEGATSFLMRNPSDTKGVFKIASATIDDLRGDQEVVLDEYPGGPEAAQCGGGPPPLDLGGITLSHYQPFEGFENPTKERPYAFWLPPYVSGHDRSNYPYVFRFSGELKNTGTGDIGSLNSSFSLVDWNGTPWPQPALSPSPIPTMMPFQVGASTFFRAAYEYSGMIAGSGSLFQDLSWNRVGGIHSTDSGRRSISVDARDPSSNPFESLWNGVVPGYLNLHSFSITAANQDAVLEPLREDSVFSVFEVKGFTGSDVRLVNPPAGVGENPPCNLAGPNGMRNPTVLKQGESCDFYVAIFSAGILDPAMASSDTIYLEGMGRESSSKDPIAHFQVPLPIVTADPIQNATYGDALIYDDLRAENLVLTWDHLGMFFSSTLPSLWYPGLVMSNLDFGSDGPSSFRNPAGVLPGLGSDSNHALTSGSLPRKVKGQPLIRADLVISGNSASTPGSDQILAHIQMNLVPRSRLSGNLRIPQGAGSLIVTANDRVGGICGTGGITAEVRSGMRILSPERSHLKVVSDSTGITYPSSYSLNKDDQVSIEVNTVDQGWISIANWTVQCAP